MEEHLRLVSMVVRYLQQTGEWKGILTPKVAHKLAESIQAVYHNSMVGIFIDAIEGTDRVVQVSVKLPRASRLVPHNRLLRYGC